MGVVWVWAAPLQRELDRVQDVLPFAGVFTGSDDLTGTVVAVEVVGRVVATEVQMQPCVTQRRHHHDDVVERDLAVLQHDAETLVPAEQDEVVDLGDFAALGLGEQLGQHADLVLERETLAAVQVPLGLLIVLSFTLAGSTEQPPGAGTSSPGSAG